MRSQRVRHDLVTEEPQLKAMTQTDTCMPALIIHNSQKVEANQRFTNRYECVTYIHYSATRRVKDLTHTTTWMNLENIMLNEMSHTQMGKYCIILLI